MKHPKFRFWPYIGVLSVLLMSATWISVFNKLDAPKSHERLQLFLASNEYQENFAETLNTTLKPPGVKDITLKALSVESPLFYTMLSTVGILDSDLLILPAHVINGIGTLNDFIALDTTLLNDFNIDTTDLTYFTNDNHHYGIKLYDGESKTNYLPAYFSFTSTEDYYVLMNTNTYNAGEYGQKGTVSSTSAFTFLALLLNKLTL